ncbi:MAG: rhodanese-like domain-containing protein [Desulfobacterales bacterium]|nr:MAG: rhodanese-like domain-containing protein [Desulfobacterales bacterium]
MTTNQEFQNIKVAKLAPRELDTLLQKEDLYILDVRPLDFKRDTSFIAGAVLCPLVYLAERYSEIPKDRRIVITDWAMKQSTSAAKFLISRDYPVVGVLKGGLERWKSENYPVEERSPTLEVGSLTAPRKQ